MRLLFSGDVAWSTGREALALSLPILKREYGPFDFIIINCENAAHGKGMTDRIFAEFMELGVDAMTSGNHIWDKPAIYPLLDAETRIFRPANYPSSCPGRGHGIIERKGKRLGILNLEGQVFMPPIDSPFTCADGLIAELKDEGGDNLPVFVDFHAEATSEKQAMAYYLDGRACAVVGTHTHVQTADERVLPHGTAYISDAGMTGGHEGILGVKYDTVMPKFIQGLPCKFEASEDGAAFNGVIVDVDDDTGLAVGIERVQLPTEALT